MNNNEVKKEIRKKRQKLLKLFVPKLLSVAILFGVHQTAENYRENNLKYNTKMELYDEFYGTYRQDKYTKGYTEGATYVREYSPLLEDGKRELNIYRVTDQYDSLNEYISLPLNEEDKTSSYLIDNIILGAKTNDSYRTIVRYNHIDYSDTQDPENLTKVKATLTSIWFLLDMIMSLISSKTKYGKGIVVDLFCLKELNHEIKDTLNDIKELKEKLNNKEINELYNNVVNKYSEINNIENDEYVKELK